MILDIYDYTGFNKKSEYEFDYLHIGKFNILNIRKPLLKHKEINSTKFDNLTYLDFIESEKIEYFDLISINSSFSEFFEIIKSITIANLKKNVVLPRYIYFCNLNNNNIVEGDTFFSTELFENGFINVVSKKYELLFYNCKNHFDRFVYENNIIFPRNDCLKDKTLHYHYQNVHSHVTYGYEDHLKRILNLNLVTDVNAISKADVIFVEQKIETFNKYRNEYKDTCKHMVSVVYGGGLDVTDEITNRIYNPNILVKSIYEYKKHLLYKKTNTCFYMAKYESLFKFFKDIYEYRKELIFENNIVIINASFIADSPASVKKTFDYLKSIYKLDLYGDSYHKGFTNVFNKHLNKNILTKYKFYLHLKGYGYLCNSVLFCIMVGMPVIMSTEHYVKTLYYQFIPRDLIILFDNEDMNESTAEEIIPTIEKVFKMTEKEYKELSYKLYIHGTYFRKFFKCETEHFFHFLNNLTPINN